jgi:3-oxoacyl-[acyl-carrier protein] reductase
MKLEGAVCIVTGSATGTGAACAIQLAKKGCRVVVNYTKSENDARQTLDTCKTAGAEAIMVKGDVGVDADLETLVAITLERFGRIDVLVNNAGVVLVKPLDETTWEDYRTVADVNLGGTFLACNSPQNGCTTNTAEVCNRDKGVEVAEVHLLIHTYFVSKLKQ